MFWISTIWEENTQKEMRSKFKKSSLLSTAPFAFALKIPVVFKLPAYVVLWANSGLRVNLAGICSLACVLLHLLQYLKKSSLLSSV